MHHGETPTVSCVVRETARRWRQRTLLPLAQGILAHASLVREANVLCARLGVHVRFQLGVQRPTPSASVCSMHDIVWTDEAVKSYVALPTAIVRVVDMDACTIRSWSLDTLARHVQDMQRMSTWDADEASHRDAHAQILGPMSPMYAALGHVYIPLIPGTRTDVPILAWWGGSPLGTCHVTVMAYGDTTYRLCIDDVRGLDPRSMDEVHWQLTWDGATYATQPVHLQLHPSSHVQVSHTCTFDPARRPQHAYATLFGRPTRTYLATLEAFDQAHEDAALAPGPAEHAWDVARVRSHAPAATSTRVHERQRRWAHDVGLHTRMHMQQVHGTTQHIAPIVRRTEPTWLLRRAPAYLLCGHVDMGPSDTLTLTPRIQRVYLGSLRSWNAQGNLVSHEPAFIPMQRMSTTDDMAMCVVWRPSQVLTSVSSSTTAVRSISGVLRITLAMDGVTSLHLDHVIRCQFHREGGPEPASWTLLPAQDHVVDTLFRITLTPQPAACADDLWMLDTRTMQIPGGTSLGPWHPRGLSLVRDYLADVVWEQAIYDAMCHSAHVSLPPPGLDTPLSFDQVRLCTSTYLVQLRRQWAGITSQSDVAYMASAVPVHIVGSTKRGWIEMQTDTLRGVWTRVWCVVQPYVHTRTDHISPFLLLRRSSSALVWDQCIFLDRAHAEALPWASTVCTHMHSPAEARRCLVHKRRLLPVPLCLRGRAPRLDVRTASTYSPLPATHGPLARRARPRPYHVISADACSLK